jgi:hypothetical protein
MTRASHSTIIQKFIRFNSEVATMNSYLIQNCLFARWELVNSGREMQTEEGMEILAQKKSRDPNINKERLDLLRRRLKRLQTVHVKRQFSLRSKPTRLLKP